MFRISESSEFWDNAHSSKFSRNQFEVNRDGWKLVMLQLRKVIVSDLSIVSNESGKKILW